MTPYMTTKYDYKEMEGSRHTPGILVEQLRSSLGAGKEQPMSRQEYGWSMFWRCLLDGVLSLERV